MKAAPLSRGRRKEFNHELRCGTDLSILIRSRPRSRAGRYTPEAELFAERCRSLGVPSENILIESASTNTGENFRFSRDLLSERGIFPRTGIAVCKPYMAKRAWATGTRQWPEVTWSVMTQPLSLEEYGADDISISLMVGDLQRLRVYAEKGFQAPVEVPDEIWSAYERLVAAGYDQYVIAS